jgi:ankyrin repeat protein
MRLESMPNIGSMTLRSLAYSSSSAARPMIVHTSHRQHHSFPSSRNTPTATVQCSACYHSVVPLFQLQRDLHRVDTLRENRMTCIYISYWACDNSLSDAALEILKRDNVDVNAEDTEGRTALYWARENGLLEIVRQLV